MMKKICYLLILLIAMMSTTVAFAEDVKGDKLNDTVSWTYDSTTKTLTISGTGAMPDYTEKTIVPWKAYTPLVEKIIISDGITSIGDFCFTFCENVKEISFPDSVTKIGRSAYGWCYGLENVQIGKNVTEIGSMAFVWCRSLKALDIPANVSTIEPGILQWATAFKEFNVSDDNQNYSDVDGVLFNKDKTELIFCPYQCEKTYEVPEGVEEISQDAFLGTAIENVVLPQSLKKISERAFMGCMNLNSVKFKAAPEQIDTLAFSNCNDLKSIEIPEGLRSIGEGAFSACKNLEYVILPKSLTSIEKDAFTSVEIKGIPNSYANEYANQNGLYFQATVKVILNGEKLEFDSAPVIIEGSTLVPMRKIFESLGAVVSWDQATNTATGKNKNTTVSIQIESSILYKNGEEIALSVPAQLIKDRTLVPLRAISESFNVSVDWDPEYFVVTLTSK